MQDPKAVQHLPDIAGDREGSVIEDASSLFKEDFQYFI